MRVLLLSPLPPPAGGMATWTLLYKNSDEAKNNDIDIINTSKIKNGIANPANRSIGEEFYRTRKIYSELRVRLRNKDYDVAHINTSCARLGIIRDYLLVRKIKRKNIKIITHLHCDTSYMVKDKITQFFFKRICKISDKIFCLSTSSQNHIKNISKKESMIIPNFIDGKLISTIKNKKTSDEIKNIAYVGHIIRTKGCDDIISAAKEMPDISFKMIGFLSEDIKRISAPDNIEYIGEVSKGEVLEQLFNADVLLFPSHTEGFPNVVLEAMACGVPIIATPVGAIPDMIENQGGILVNIRDADGIVKAIKYLQNKECREQMSLWNQQKVMNAYTTEIVMKRIFKEYSNI